MFMLLFLRLHHSCISKLLPERAETLVYGINRISFAHQIPGSLAEGGLEAGKLSSNPSSKLLSRLVFFCNPFAALSAFLSGRLGALGVLRDMACLLSVSLGFEVNRAAIFARDEEAAT
jgi:hypothetical protein